MSWRYLGLLPGKAGADRGQWHPAAPLPAVAPAGWRWVMCCQHRMACGRQTIARGAATAQLDLTGLKHSESSGENSHKPSAPPAGPWLPCTGSSGWRSWAGQWGQAEAPLRHLPTELTLLTHPSRKGAAGLLLRLTWQKRHQETFIQF